MGIILFLIPPDPDGGTTTITISSATPPLLNPVPPSDDPPVNYTDYETITVGLLILNATGNISGMIPHSGPITFNVALMINITNTGAEDITDFQAIKMSLYYQTSDLFYTFSFTSDENITILAGESLTLNCINKETLLYTSFNIAVGVYARVLVSFNSDQECILTTPILEGIFAIE